MEIEVEVAWAAVEATIYAAQTVVGTATAEQTMAQATRAVEYSKQTIERLVVELDFNTLADKSVEIMYTYKEM